MFRGFGAKGGHGKNEYLDQHTDHKHCSKVSCCLHPSLLLLLNSDCPKDLYSDIFVIGSLNPYVSSFVKASWDEKSGPALVSVRLLYSQAPIS
jgi:hypothetical protein